MPAVPNPFFSTPSGRFLAGAGTGLAQAFDTRQNESLRGQLKIDLAERELKAREQEEAELQRRLMESTPKFLDGIQYTQALRTQMYDGLMLKYQEVLADPELSAVFGFTTSTRAGVGSAISSTTKGRGGGLNFGLGKTRLYTPRDSSGVGYASSTTSAEKGDIKTGTGVFYNPTLYANLSPEQRAKVDALNNDTRAYSSAAQIFKENKDFYETAYKAYNEGKIDEATFVELENWVQDEDNALQPIPNILRRRVDLPEEIRKAGDQVKDLAAKLKRIEKDNSLYVREKTTIDAGIEAIINQARATYSSAENRRALSDSYKREFGSLPTDEQLLDYTIGRMGLPMVKDANGKSIYARFEDAEDAVMLPQPFQYTRNVRESRDPLSTLRVVDVNFAGTSQAFQGGLQNTLEYQLPRPVKRNSVQVDADAVDQFGNQFYQGREDVKAGAATLNNVTVDGLTYLRGKDNKWRLYEQLNVFSPQNFQFVEDARDSLVQRALSAGDEDLANQIKSMPRDQLYRNMNFTRYANGQATFQYVGPGANTLRSGKSGSTSQFGSTAPSDVDRSTVSVPAPDAYRRIFNPVKGNNPYNELPVELGDDVATQIIGGNYIGRTTLEDVNEF